MLKRTAGESGQSKSPMKSKGRCASCEMKDVILLEEEVALDDGMCMKWGQLASPARQHGIQM